MFYSNTASLSYSDSERRANNNVRVQLKYNELRIAYQAYAFF